MKRPDLFLCVNMANKDRLLELFGVYPQTYKSYLKFTRELLDMPWASSTKRLALSIGPPTGKW